MYSPHPSLEILIEWVGPSHFIRHLLNSNKKTELIEYNLIKSSWVANFNPSWQRELEEFKWIELQGLC